MYYIILTSVMTEPIIVSGYFISRRKLVPDLETLLMEADDDDQSLLTNAAESRWLDSVSFQNAPTWQSGSKLDNVALKFYLGLMRTEMQVDEEPYRDYTQSSASGNVLHTPQGFADNLAEDQIGRTQKRVLMTSWLGRKDGNN